MSETRENTWVEYKLVCSKNKTHYIKDRSQSNPTTTIRELAIANLGYMNSPRVGEPPCDGNHTLESRTIVRVTTTTEWGPLDMSAPLVTTRDRILHECLKHWCPKCGADLETMCYNLTRNTTPPTHTKWPHSERMDAAGIDSEGAMVR